MTSTTPIPPKILVAVHGIGDQIANATVQSVAFRVYEHYGLPPAVPLGRFHRSPKSPPGVELFTRASDPKFPAPLGFAEVYWADVPRQLVDKGFTLEDAKLWARTLVARLNMKAAVEQQMDWREYRMLETIVGELVDAVFVIDNLTFLADRAGLFTFDLKKVLDNFLNDVQVVTEFEEYRDSILQKFSDVMEVIANDPAAKDAEIYIVGHSEGSVVAYFGLLKALSAQSAPPRWTGQVKGLMTIGSPIETHLLLWADLWQYRPSPVAAPAAPIVWWNYLDHGDPIAYRLIETRAWMKKHGWMRHFDFPDAHDVGFSRYVLPGKAHVDYWADHDLFAHFIENVMHLPKAPPNRDGDGPDRQTPAGPPAAPPRSRVLARISASLLPFLLVGTLMFLAVYSLYTPVEHALGAQLKSRVTFGNLIGLTLLLAGVTATVRVPRVTSAKRWWAGAGLFFLAALWLYPVLVAPVTQNLIGNALAVGPLQDLTLEVKNLILPVSMLVTAVVASVWSFWHPARGVWPLLVPGCVLSLGLVVRILVIDEGDTQVWPILLGSAFFLYLWWLATLLLDLSVVWHSYVRWSSAMDAMRTMIGDPEEPPTADSSRRRVPAR